MVSGSADASASRVILKFAGAVPSGEFTVSVNGKPVAVQSVERTDRSVTLLLPEGSVQAGDEVVVSWQGDSTTLTAE